MLLMKKETSFVNIFFNAQCFAFILLKLIRKKKVQASKNTEVNAE